MKTIFRRLRCYFFGHTWGNSMRFSPRYDEQYPAYYCLNCAKHVFFYQKDFVRIRSNEAN